MTREQIRLLIKTHSNLRDWAKHILDTSYDSLEENGQLDRWLNDYIRHKKIVSDLEKEVPDDG